MERSNGGIRFRDGKTQSTVMLQNSEIIEISKDQYLSKRRRTLRTECIEIRR